MAAIDTPLIGAVYLIEQKVPLSRQRFDLQNMADAGFNLVVLWPPVSRWDSPDGASIAFDSVDRVMDLCHELQLRVVLELEGQNPAMQFAPDCAFALDQMPQSDLARHWLNYFHPKVDAAITDYCRQVARHFKDHPALWGYDLFNEVNFHSTDPHTVAAFRQWVRDKYQDIRELNYVWGRHYTAFDQIYPENFAHPYSMWSSLRPLLDFEDFRADAIVSFIRRWGDAVRSVDDKHVLIADNSWSMTTFDTVTLANDDWKVAAAADIFGLSIYPQSWDVRLRKNPCAVSQIYRGGVCAAGGKPVMVSELQTHNQTALASGSSVFDEIALWTWQAFAHGVQGLVYWKWNPFIRGKQVSGRGLTAQDGTPNNRARQAGRVAKALRDHPAAIGPRKVYDSGVALLYNPTCDRFCDLIMPDEKGLYRKSFAGWYRFLWQFGINPAIVQATDLPKRHWRHLKVLVAPMQAMVGRADAQLLRQFVDAGGRIVADSRFAIVDENGFAYEHAPGGLADLFGYQETDFLSPYPDEDQPFATRFSKVALAGGRAVAASPTGDPLVVAGGSTLYIATPFGLEPLPATADLVAQFLNTHIDSRCRVLERGDDVDVTISQGSQLLVAATNYSNQPQQVRVRLDRRGDVQAMFECEASASADGDGMVLQFTVAGRDVAGFVIGQM